MSIDSFTTALKITTLALPFQVEIQKSAACMQHLYNWFKIFQKLTLPTLQVAHLIHPKESNNFSIQNLPSIYASSIHDTPSSPSKKEDKKRLNCKCTHPPLSLPPISNLNISPSSTTLKLTHTIVPTKLLDRNQTQNVTQTPKNGLIHQTLKRRNQSTKTEKKNQQNSEFLKKSFRNSRRAQNSQAKPKPLITHKPLHQKWIPFHMNEAGHGLRSSNPKTIWLFWSLASSLCCLCSVIGEDRIDPLAIDPFLYFNGYRLKSFNPSKKNHAETE